MAGTTSTAEADGGALAAAESGAREAAHRAADDRIRALYEKRAPWAAAPATREEKLRCAFATAGEDPAALAAWQRLLYHLGRTNRLVSIEPVIPHLGPQAGNTGIDALLHLALKHEDWLREPEAWRPATHAPPRETFHELARHLLARYPVPAFLDAAWFEGFTLDGNRHRGWFALIGGGRNIRAAGNCPVRLTSLAAHHFLQAPDDASIVAALRWGQVQGLGGDPYLAQAVAASRMGTLLPDEPFWESVLHFFVNNARRATGSVGPLVDFIYGQKFGEAGDFSDAPEPGFSMKGRTLPALQKRVAEWHEQLAREQKRPRKVWSPTGIEPFHTEERDAYGTLNTWTVQELLDSKALQDEGR